MTKEELEADYQRMLKQSQQDYEDLTGSKAPSSKSKNKGNMFWWTLAVIMNIPSIASVVGAIILAYNHINGWGWFILAAILTNKSFKFKE